MPENTWQKSSYSGAHDECVEVRSAGGLIEVRESDDPDVIVSTNTSAFTSLLHTVKAGELDHHA
ncbi:DUF397 domain-containing protein [Kitasatospora sp. NPDC001527]|uniref:DUF397 domain-containing protein n=1 Tax=Kitasatospora sp. NPDC001527 TaxID=3154519 RepID=UPI003331D512